MFYSVTENKSETKDFYWFKNIYLNDVLVGVIDGTTTKQTLTDHLNSTDKTLNTSGNILSSTDYLSFGKERIQTGTQAVRKYIGEELDQTTGLNYLNARYYNSSNGQFTSQDPVFWQLGTSDNGKKALLNPQSQNSYSYSLNNPITYKDPDGEFAFPALIVALPAIETGLGYLGAAAATYYTAQTAATLAGTALSGAPQEYKNQVYRDVATQFGLAASLQAGMVGSAYSGAGKSLKGVQANKAAGEAFESQFAKTLNSTAKPQITLETSSGVKTRIDFMTKNSSGEYCLFECKSSATAPLTKNQSIAFPQIEKFGATIVGKGKEGFGGGLVIPPTKVNIVRPK